MDDITGSSCSINIHETPQSDQGKNLDFTILFRQNLNSQDMLYFPLTGTISRWILTESGRITSLAMIDIQIT